VQLGTNGTMSDELFNRLVAIVEGVPRVVVLNIRVPRDWEEASNAAINGGVPQHPAMRLGDWYTASHEPGALGDDGVHPTKHGARLYAALILDGTKDAPPPTTTTAPTTTTTAPTPTTTTTTAPSPAPSLPSPAVKIDIGGGTRLFVDVDGAGLVPEGPAMQERPTIVFLHGGPGSDHSLFKASPLAELHDIAQLVYYDHRGQGRSDGVDPADWNLDTWADDVVRLCDALGIEKPIVLGASFGGFVAQRYLARHRDHAAKVVLLGTRSSLEVGSIARSFAALGGPEAGDAASRFWSGDGSAMQDYMTHCMPLYSSSPPNIEAMMRTVMKNEVLEHFQATEQQTMDTLPGLEHAGCPVLVVGGERDPICPAEESERIAAALPSDRVTLARVEGAHLQACGESPEVVQLVRDFVRS
jgi:pimeloyl-ACP methyl ester carboxylesterase